MEKLCQNDNSVAIYRDILDYQRNWLLVKNKDDTQLDEAIIRKHLVRLDLEEERLFY